MSEKNILWAVLVALIWGLNFVVIQIGLGDLPPLLFSALRFTLAGLPALGLVGRNGIPWRWIVILGLVMGVASNALLFVGMTCGISAGLSSLVMQTHVVFTLGLSWLLFREHFSWRQRLGVALAFGGIVVLAGRHTSGMTFTGFAMALGAAFAWAVFTILLKRVGQVEMPRLMIWISMVPPLPLLGLSLAFERGQWQAIEQIHWGGLMALFYTAVISTLLAGALWGRLVKHYTPSIVAPFALLVPVFGMASARIALGEHYDAGKWLASLLVMAGLSVVVFDPYRVAIPMAAWVRNRRNR
jgi:O-acetylserine/cysteine efflux transporter